MEPIQIRARLLMKGKTMKQFAETIGTTRQCIHYVVTGRTRSKKYRMAIADFLGMSVDEIWPDDKKETPNGDIVIIS